MDAVSIATTLIAAQQQNTQQAVQTAVMKNDLAMQRSVIDLINASAANLAAIEAMPPSGMGLHVNRSV